ncbi:MAG: MoaD/ThiS family protein [Deltaproteobacteria bacterium]|nr:MAG: MoaD/ThiS family protein [Deltaproteobacteria bacterium]
MEVEIRLFASLQRYRLERDRIHLEEGTTVAGLLEKMGIPPTEAAIVLVNGRHAQNEQRLNDGEQVAFFPPIAGG